MELITLVPQDRYEEAVRCLTGRRRSLAMQSAIKRLAAAGRLPDGCLRAMTAADGTFLAVVLLVPSPGRTATITLSPPRGADGSKRCEALLAASCGALDEWPVDMAQALLVPGDMATLNVYLRCGFLHLADLWTMKRSPRRTRKEEPMPAGVELRCANDEELPAILDETYIDTKDCPDLHGIRRTQDILVGHQAGGHVLPELWQTILLNGDAVGCILVTCGPDKIADLAYVGLAPRARGKGIGRAVVNCILGRLPAEGMRVLRLAVDASNDPAVHLYRQLGFKHTATQCAVIRSVRRMQVGEVAGEDVHMTSTPPRGRGG